MTIEKELEELLEQEFVRVEAAAFEVLDWHNGRYRKGRQFNAENSTKLPTDSVRQGVVDALGAYLAINYKFEWVQSDIEEVIRFRIGRQELIYELLTGLTRVCDDSLTHRFQTPIEAIDWLSGI